LRYVPFTTRIALMVGSFCVRVYLTVYVYIIANVDLLVKYTKSITFG